MIAEAAQIAILDGAFERLITVYPTGLYVRLLRNQNEVVGNGYSRQPILAADPAEAASEAVFKATDSVTFNASGGSIVYDAIDVVDSVGNQLFPPCYPESIETDGSVSIPPGGSQEVAGLFRSPQQDVDSAARIQTYFNQFKVYGQEMRPVVGEVLCPTTLTTGYRSGGVIIGKGGTTSLPLSSTLSGPASRWIWSGARTAETTDPLLRFQGADMAIMHHSFDGGTRAQVTANAPKGPCGIWVDPTAGRGLGVGKLHLFNVAFSWWRTAIRLGVNTGSANCDESSYYDCLFGWCENAVELEGYQTLGHHFYHPRFGLCDVCFNLKSGGDLHVHGGFVAHPGSFLKFPAGTAGNFGQNNNGYHIQGLKVDSQATGLLLVDQYPITTEGYYSNIIFDGLHLPSPQIAAAEVDFWGGNAVLGDPTPSLAPAFKLTGTTALTLRNAINLQRGMLTWDVSSFGHTRIIVENARIFYRPAYPVTDVRHLCDLTRSRGTAHVTFRNCFDYKNLAPLADFTGTLTGLL